MRAFKHEEMEEIYEWCLDFLVSPKAAVVGTLLIVLILFLLIWK